MLVQIVNMGPVVQSSSLLAVDATFILTATAFLSTGSLLGIQRYGRFAKYPGDVLASSFGNSFALCYRLPCNIVLHEIHHGTHDVHHAICCNLLLGKCMSCHPCLLSHPNLQNPQRD